MAKAQHSNVATVHPDQLTREIEKFLSEKQTSIAQSIDQLLQDKKEIDRKVAQDKAAVDERIEKLNELYHKATGRYYVPTKKADTNGAAPGGRQRRGKAELEADAKAIVQFLESKGKDGASGAEVRDRFPKVGVSIKDFVSKYGAGKVTTEGQKSQTRYFVG